MEPFTIALVAGGLIGLGKTALDRITAEKSEEGQPSREVLKMRREHEARMEKLHLKDNHDMAEMGDKAQRTRHDIDMLKDELRVGNKRLEELKAK